MLALTIATAGMLLFADDLPRDAAALIKEVQTHQAKMDELRENYTYHRLMRTEELNGKGLVTKTTLREDEVIYVNGHQIRRLVKKEGMPLSEAEDKKERERVRKLTVEFSKKPPQYGNGGGVSPINTILAVSEVSNPRRTVLKGRATLTFDFKGNPKAEAHGMEANGAKKLAGTIWIDELDKQVARLEVEFYENFRIGGGLLASVRKGTIMRIEQSPIGEGLWLQTLIERRMNVRVVTKNLHENTRATNFDFRRFNVEAVQH